MTHFQKLTTAHGLDVYLHQTTQFRTTTVQLLIDRPFDDDYSLFALLPHVLKRGNANFPDSLALEQRFDQLYGASFGVTTHRLGERHVVEMLLELADESLLAEPEPLFASGLRLLAGLLLNPLAVQGAFSAAYVEQEREAQIRAIHSVYNDKAEYAHQRCLQEVFKGDTYARQSIGDAAEVAAITPSSLWEFYQRMLAEANFQLFITGNIDAAQVRLLCDQAFNQPLGSRRLCIEHSQVLGLRSPQQLVEEQPVAQGKLVLAYRTGINRRDPLYLASLIYNGLLGGFSHSKLFQHVREQASLAYDCSSGLLATRGLLLVEAGISPSDLAAARAIIDLQLEAMRAGDWRDADWEKTVLGLQNNVRGLADRPTRLALTHFERSLNGVSQSDEDLLVGLGQVSKEQVLSVAAQVCLDTAYFLQGTEEDEESSTCS